MRGGRPRDLGEKIFLGTYRTDRDRGLTQPNMPLEIPPAPRWLNRLGRGYYAEIAKILSAARVITAADQFPMAQAAHCLATHRAAARVIEKLGFTYSITSASGVVIRPRPEAQIMADADRRARSWLEQLGCTPAARPHVHAMPPPRGENPFAALDREQRRQRFFGGRRA